MKFLLAKCHTPLYSRGDDIVDSHGLSSVKVPRNRGYKGNSVLTSPLPILLRMNGKILTLINQSSWMIGRLLFQGWLTTLMA